MCISTIHKGQMHFMHYYQAAANAKALHHLQVCLCFTMLDDDKDVDGDDISELASSYDRVFVCSCATLQCRWKDSQQFN